MKRREVLKISGAAAVALGSGGIAAAAQGKQRPNVIVILTDDQGYEDLSIHGNPVLKTPHLDRLASGSVRFTDFHASPVCTPTRAELMTGTDCMRNLACSVVAGRGIPRRDIPMMAELLKKGGYATGLFGKWHLGYSYPDRPMDRGFDKAVWFKGWGLTSEIELDNDYENPRYLDGMQTRRAAKYCTDLWFDEAIAWMGKHHEARQPFFAYIATNTPHGPLWPPKEYAGLYAGKVDQPTADFFAMVANLDDNVGRLEQWLSRSRALDNTVVVFLCDNGGTVGKRVHTAGLREQKASHYEGGHRVPCFLRWPGGGYKQGLQVKVPTRVEDVLPTLLDICSVPAKKETFDGVSLVPLVHDRGIADRMFVVQFGLRTRPRKYEAAVIWNQWRLQKGVELYEIDADRAQTKDVAAQHPTIVERMRAYYEEWWDKMQPGLAQPVPKIIGSGVEPADDLTCADWWEVDCDNLLQISDAVGGPRGGAWYLDVVTAGEYQVELRRWPFHTQTSIGSDGPRATISGRPLNQPVKRIMAHAAGFSVDERELIVQVKPDDLGARFSVKLNKGLSRVQGWFRGADGKDLCGAYYARMTKIA